MKTAIHNVAPKTSAERVAALVAAIDRAAVNIRNHLGTAPAKPDLIANKFTAPPGDDGDQLIANRAVPQRAAPYGHGAEGKFTAPKGDD